MPKSRSLRSILEATKGKNRIKNPAAVITKDAEASLSAQSIPSPTETLQNAKGLVDAFAGEGTTKDLLGSLGKSGDVIKGLLKI